MSTKRWEDMSPAQVEDAFQVRAQRDPKYALAWAVCRLANAQHRTADALDALGIVGIELKRIADAMEKQAQPARHGRGSFRAGLPPGGR